MIQSKEPLQASELRIGNWVKYEDEYLHMTTYGRVNSITPLPIKNGTDHTYIINVSAVDSSSNFGNVQDENIIDLEPIELDDQVLDAIGFNNDVWRCLQIGEWDGAKWSLRGNKGCFFLCQENEQGQRLSTIFDLIKDEPDEIKDKFGWIQPEDKVLIPIRLQYLHQLQNLFFSLTNQELTITL